jgi:hypothetical protein
MSEALLSALASSPSPASSSEPRLLARRAFAPPASVISRTSTVASSSSFLLDYVEDADFAGLNNNAAQPHGRDAAPAQRCRSLLELSVPVLVLTIMNAVRGASFGQLLFPPGLAPALARIGGAHAGTSMFLVSTALAGVSALVLSRLPFASGGASIEMLPMYANICAAVLAHDSLRGSADAELVSTTLAAFATWYVMNLPAPVISCLRTGWLTGWLTHPILCSFILFLFYNCTFNTHKTILIFHIVAL